MLGAQQFGGVQLNQNVLQAMAQLQSQQLAAAAAGMQVQQPNPQYQQQLVQQQYQQQQGQQPQHHGQMQTGQGAPPAQAKRQPTGDAGIVGLCAVTMKALTPCAHMDPEWTLEEMAWKICGHIGKAAKNYWGGEDERFSQRATVAKGQSIIEEFVEACMHNISSGCGEKPWFNEANFTDPLFHAVMGTFQNKQTMFMCRTLKPVIQKTVDDAVARFREEERLQKGLWEAVIISGLPEAFQKGASKHLQSSFDRAHMNAPYGSCKAETAEIGLVQDFVKGWMNDFAGRAWSALNEGVGEDGEEQYAFLTTLFQHLTDPEQCCLPFELVSQPGAMPPENWSFVADTAMEIIKGGGDNGGEMTKKERKRKAAEEWEAQQGR